MRPGRRRLAGGGPGLRAWVRRSEAGDLALRFEALAGARVVLRVERDGVLRSAPAAERGEEEGLGPAELRAARLWLVAGGTREELVLDGITEEDLARLPAGEWVELRRAGGRLALGGTAEAPPPPAVEPAGEDNDTEASLELMPDSGLRLGGAEEGGAHDAVVRYLRRSLARERRRAWRLERRVAALEAALRAAGIEPPPAEDGDGGGA